MLLFYQPLPLACKLLGMGLSSKAEASAKQELLSSGMKDLPHSFPLPGRQRPLDGAWAVNAASPTVAMLPAMPRARLSLQARQAVPGNAIAVGAMAMGRSRPQRPLERRMSAIGACCQKLGCGDLAGAPGDGAESAGLRVGSSGVIRWFRLATRYPHHPRNWGAERVPTVTQSIKRTRFGHGRVVVCSCGSYLYKERCRHLGNPAWEGQDLCGAAAPGLTNSSSAVQCVPARNLKGTSPDCDFQVDSV